MAAKKKPTRTGPETKSYTSASARMQAKGKSGQKSASAAHKGKPGKSKPYSPVARAEEDLNRLSGGRARRAKKVVDENAIKIVGRFGKVREVSRHDSVKGKPLNALDAEESRQKGKRPGASPSSPGAAYRSAISYYRNQDLNPQSKYPYSKQGYRGPGEPKNPHGEPFMGPHRQIDFPRWESPSERNEQRRNLAKKKGVK